MSSVNERLSDLVCQQLNIDKEKLVPTFNFIDDHGIDSLDMSEIIMEAEEEFDIDISDDKVNSVKTYGDLLDLVTELTAPE